MNHTKKNFIHKFKLNRVIWLLTLSDIFTWGLHAIIIGFVGLFLAGKLNYNPVEILGIGTAIFYFAKGTLQIPIGMVTDKIKRDRDDITFLLAGNLLMGIPYLFYPSIQTASGYYFLQFLIGVGAAMNLVNWRKLFARNLNKGDEGLDYGVYDTIMSYTMILFSVLAGIIAVQGQQYFDLVMYIVGGLMLTSGFWVILIYFTKGRK